MADLFSRSDEARGPLPARLRPRRLEDFVGQSEVVAQLSGRALQSLILYGPPGCGKTTLAHILSERAGLPCYALSAVSAGVKDVRGVIDQGRERFFNHGAGVVLFLDEIHRFSKSQQDSLLEAVESGWILLIGATTEHPSFGIIGPLLSRARVYTLQPLGETELQQIATRALENDPALLGLELDQAGRDLLVEAAAGDARRLLSFLEAAAASGSRPDPAQLRAIIETNLRNYDRAGENHYDFASAFIKSLRGSDPDAALVYLAAMLERGEDPLFLARRMIIFASEDVGNASPQALQIAVAAFMAAERIGMPEVRIVLSQAATFLAASPKSNAAYLGIDRALEQVKARPPEIPLHLRNAPSRLHREAGAGKGYRYPHDFPGHFVRQDYLPGGYEAAAFYQPTGEGQEARIRDRLRQLWPTRYPDSE
ncbi:MAG: replication-associated recombination protein A [Spirochaetales bacterium]|nr:replication-associated recombination protein A [Leptospiraceae bacterium]MCP5482897.1 replication-associated recombination protein A [Spirochaetales bacterium]